MSDFPLATAIASALADDIEALREGRPCALREAVTPVTAELLDWWFAEDATLNRPGLNFHRGQRDAILAVIYAHEVLGAESVRDLYQRLAPEAMVEAGRFGELTAERNRHPKYAAKMATGTGKTWVLGALLVWQYLNAVDAPDDPRFTSDFLVVAPGLIVYDRLLDSFLGRRTASGDRDFTTSDLVAQGELFVPPTRRDELLAFVRSAVVEKQDIGRRLTPGGSIVITNWQRLMGARDEDPDFLEDDNEGDETDRVGAGVDVAAAARSFLPLSPGLSAGNSLDVLDRRWAAGGPLDWLVERPSLMVFNDEAHHVHSGRRGDEDTEVEWQRTMNRIAAGKGRRFTQIDFSATPYNESRGRRRYFDHIVVDFPLLAATQGGLVKSLAFDRRQEVAALPLDFRAERDELGDPTLSSGQRTMLQAGLERLRILEEQFAEQDPDKHPKLLVMVEDTRVAPRVIDFLRESGLADDEVLRVDSGRKSEVGRVEWDRVKSELFDIDSRAKPRVIVSVLMLREGFDVNSICVIVPLRSAGSGILAEQTVGRGLRLMWRGDEQIDELKRETRTRMLTRQPPTNFFDVLFLVEHPRFQDLYDEISEGIATIDDRDDDPPATGDAERVGLREGFDRYDFSIPFIRREAPEEMRPLALDIAALPTSRYPIDDLLRVTRTGDRFTAEDYETRTRFGGFTVDGAQLSARGYNEWLAKLANRVAGAIGRTFTTRGTLTRRAGAESDFIGAVPVGAAEIVRWADRYIRTRWAGRPFDPFENESWRVLMVDSISDEISGALATELVTGLTNITVGEPDVVFRRLSEVESLVVRRSSGIDVAKCIYPRLPVPSHGGGFERDFILWADRDTEIEALVKIHEYRHDFLRRAYLKANGMPALYSPDFMVRTAWDVYVVETKAQSFLDDADVRRKQNAALGWAEQINELPPELRSSRTWSYVLLGDRTARGWMAQGATASTALAIQRLHRAREDATLPGL